MLTDEEFYHSKKYRHWRECVLRRAKYQCERCKRYGRNRTATIAHHKLPRHEHPELQLDVDNGEALCAGCHNTEHPEKGGRGGYPPRY